MANNELNLPLATSTWDENEYLALQRVINSGRFTMGPLVKSFEEKFAESFGSKFAVMVNSGSSANLLAVAAAVLDDRVDLNPGDEIIVPAVSWATTYYPLQQYGLVLKFVDIDIDTLNMDVSLLEDAISQKTKGIFLVNLLGNPNNYIELQKVAEKHSLLLLEDNCESMGASFNGIKAGTFGKMGTFSSFFSHHISTMEGGVIVTDDVQLYQELLSLRAHGWTRDLPSENYVHNKSGEPFDDLFRFVLPGYNARPLEMSGAIGIEQLNKLPAIIAGRRENAKYFQKLFSDNQHFRIQQEVGESTWFGFSLILEGKMAGHRKEVVEALTMAGIEVRPIVGGNFTRNPVMKYLKAIVPNQLAAADKAHFDGLFVGNHHFPVVLGIDSLKQTLDTVVDSIN